MRRLGASLEGIDIQVGFGQCAAASMKLGFQICVFAFVRSILRFHRELQQVKFTAKITSAIPVGTAIL